MPILAPTIRALAVAIIIAGLQTASAACFLESARHRAALVELYTSEGCSSCPPADRWLSSLRSDEASHRLVALAFHVDYWNQLGWIDRFSKPAFSERQREVAARLRSRVIYTPQVVLDGKDLRSWANTSQFSQRIAEVNRRASGARITATATLSGSQLALRGTVEPQPARPNVSAWVALFQNSLTSTVSAGENAGRTLRHDFVVRALLGPLPAQHDGSARFARTLEFGKDWDVGQFGIAVFAQDMDTGEVLQAVSRDACL